MQKMTAGASGSYPSTMSGLGVPYDMVHNVIFEKYIIIAATNHMTTFSPPKPSMAGDIGRTPKYRSGGLMRNLENLAFRFGQNFQKISILVQMASGVRQKVQNLFRWAHQASN